MADFQDIHPPIRSISLPSRLQPDSIKVVSDLKKLRSFPESFTAEDVRARMTGLADAILRVQEMLTSPLTRKVLAKPGNGGLVESALDGSVAVIDACGGARELMLAMREQVREVQSCLRRSRGGSKNFPCLERQIQSFLSFRKKAKKEAAKRARDMKNIADSYPSPEAESSAGHLEVVTRALNEVNAIAGSVVNALMEFLSATKVNSGRWSAVSRLMLGSSSAQKRCQWLTEVERVDSDLCSILRAKNDIGIDLKTTQKRLEALEGCMEGLEEGLEVLFKCLIQNRVALLNVLTC